MSIFAERGQEIFNLKPPSKQTQREKIIWTQHNRTSGTWAKCSAPQCQKWRYLKNTFDPVDIPTVWECSMNPDQEYNACSKPQSPELKNITLVKLNFTAGSLVWVNSARYLRWPGMVDDDPELAQFYWLNALSREREASMYHIVFIDKDTSHVSRQWFSAHELEVFTLNNSESVAGKQARLIESVRLAREALKMNIFQRLQRFSFARLFRGHIYSFGHTMRSIVVSAGFDMNSDSDCTLLSSSYSDEEMDVNYSRRGSRYSDYSDNVIRRRAPPSDYSEKVTKRRRASSVGPDDYSEKVTRGRRDSSVGPGSDDYSEKVTRRRRASSVGPGSDDYSEKVTRRRRTSSVGPGSDDYSENGARKRAPSVVPNDYSEKVTRRRRASSVGPGSDKYSEKGTGKRAAPSVIPNDYSEKVTRRGRNSSVGPDEYSEKGTGKRAAPSLIPNDYSEVVTKRRRASSVAPDDFFSKNGARKRAPSVVPNDYSEKVTRRGRASSVAPDDFFAEYGARKRAPSVAPNDRSLKATIRKRASSVAPDDYSENITKIRREPSVAPGGYSENGARRRKATSVVSNNVEFSSKKKRTSAVVVSPSERILRSQTRNNVDEEMSSISNAGNNESSEIVLNELFHGSGGNAFHPEISLPSSHSTSLLNVDIGERGMIGGTVLKLSTTKWKFSVDPGRKKGIPPGKRY